MWSAWRVAGHRAAFLFTSPASSFRALANSACARWSNQRATQRERALRRETAAQTRPIQAMDNIGVVRLKLTGCGQSLELEVENGETVGRLLDKCAEEMGGGVTRRHVKLVARG